MLDSGGFLIQMNNTLNIEAESIIELYSNIEGVFKVVLDHPLNPNQSNSTNRRKWLKTIYRLLRPSHRRHLHCRRQLAAEGADKIQVLQIGMDECG